jgi:hypothetical protein
VCQNRTVRVSVQILLSNFTYKYPDVESCAHARCPSGRTRPDRLARPPTTEATWIHPSIEKEALQGVRHRWRSDGQRQRPRQHSLERNGVGITSRISSQTNDALRLCVCVCVPVSACRIDAAGQGDGVAPDFCLDRMEVPMTKAIDASSRRSKWPSSRRGWQLAATAATYSTGGKDVRGALIVQTILPIARDCCCGPARRLATIP